MTVNTRDVVRFASMVDGDESVIEEAAKYTHQELTILVALMSCALVTCYEQWAEQRGETTEELMMKILDSEQHKEV